jgi:hypothetical protein
MTISRHMSVSGWTATTQPGTTRASADPGDPTISPTLDRLVRRAGVLSVVGTVLIAPWPAIAKLATPAYLLVILSVLAGAALFVATQPKQLRTFAASVFCVAFFLHFAALVLFAWIQVRFEGGYVLSFDCLMFYRNTLALAAGQLGITPAVLGSADIGHYLIFSTLVRHLHADLFAIQVFDCGLLAIAGSLMVDLAPLVPRRISLFLALFAAAFPTFIANAAFDLWKEPSLFFASVLFLSSTLKMWRAEPGWGQAAFAGLSTIALTYLRCTRFYLVAYIESAVVVLAVLVLVRRVPINLSRVAAMMLVCVIAIAEVGPWLRGWPLTPELMLEQISYTLHTPLMLNYASGSLGAAHHERLLTPPTHGLQRVPDAKPAPAVALAAIAYVPPPEQTELRTRRGVMAHPIDAFRRLYGPFIWILPSHWKLQLLFTTDYLLYPGMAIWYVALPFVIVGLMVVLWGAAVGRETNMALVGLAVFLVLYFAQYMTINLSYRHRDIMVPLLMIFAWAGWNYVKKISQWRRAYACYWLALCLLAAGHLLARALMQHR